MEGELNNSITENVICDMEFQERFLSPLLNISVEKSNTRE